MKNRFKFASLRIHFFKYYTSVQICVSVFKSNTNPMICASVFKSSESVTAGSVLASVQIQLGAETHCSHFAISCSAAMSLLVDLHMLFYIAVLYILFCLETCKWTWWRSCAVSSTDKILNFKF